jgi:tetratricopeptide (TPR) repeat protein
MQRVSESYRKTASLQKTAKYGCCDPMEDLLKVLCCVEEEYIEMAEIMEQSGNVEKAAKIYYKYGYDQKYIDCLQKRLAKNSNTYMELIDYYSSHDCYEKAVELAWLALEKCKDYNLNALIFCR